MLRVLHSSLSPLTCSPTPSTSHPFFPSPPSAPFPSSNRKPPQANITHLERQQIKMAGHQNIPGSVNHRISGTTILYATLSGLAIGVPLLGMMGFTLLASLTLLLVAYPLLLLFSPVILPAAFVVAASMAGFSLAAALAVVGVSTSMLPC